jgi:hypothetical protein
VLAEERDPAKSRLRPVVNSTAGNIAKFIDTTNIDNSILFESAGKIGLSTTSPQGPLHINSVMIYRGSGVGSIQTGTNPGVMLENPSTNSTVLLTESFGLSVFASTSSTLPLSGSDQRFVIRPTGNVGIGVNNPQAPLHIGGPKLYRSLNVAAVQTGTNPGLMLENPATNSTVALTENNGLFVYTTPSSTLPVAGSDLRMVLKMNGDVGIGISAPPARLSVQGTDAPPTAGSPGFDAAPVLQVVGGRGGDSNSSGVGGKGGSILIQSGDGGNAGIGTGIGGAGGSITLKLGVGGTGDNAGATGKVIITGDSFHTTAGNGVILKSPNGSVCRKVTIDDTGALVLVPVSCIP